MGALTQNIILEAASDYQIAYRIRSVGSVDVAVSSGNYSRTITNETISVVDTFTNNAGGGSFSVSVTPQIGATDVFLESLSVKKYTAAEVSDNKTVKEFLSGNTDDGKVVHFRVDTQILQLQAGPELYSTPIAVVTEADRGTQMKIFVNLDEKDFYQLEGTVTKGISVIKFRPNRDGTDVAQLGKTIQLSYRDSSKNLCRLLQVALITIPTPIDFAQ